MLIKFYGCIGSFIGIVSLAVLTNSPAIAQVAETAKAVPEVAVSPISARYVPNDALVVLVASPAEMIDSSAFEMFPIEVLRVQSLEKIGVDPADIATVKAVIGMPGPAGPQFGVIFETVTAIDLAKLLNAFQADSDPVQVSGRASYALDGPPGIFLHQFNANTILVASEGYLDLIATADKGTGPLASLVAKMPRPAGLTAVAVLEPVRPILSGLAEQQAQQLPPPLQPLAQIPNLVDALLINTNLGNAGLQLRLTMLCADDAGATEVERILNTSISVGREIGIAQVQDAMQNSRESEAMAKATLQYANRIANTIAATLKPTRSGRRVTLSIESSTGIATTGVMVGLLLPAVQAAREAARRMSASNNLKQIMLAMHNYNAAYGKLPPPAIMSAAGEPLLSWRVAILPFVEQQALYEQFHLDEPWDSAHNLPLSETLPSVFQDPSLPLPAGQTVFQAVVGESIGLKSEGNTTFANFTDGTSNSILVVEANSEFAVPWSKPEDVAIDLEDPLASMGHIHQGGFHVALADGAIKFITHSIDPAMFVSMLTRDAGD